MNRFRCFLIAGIVVIFSATSGLAGVIQGPGKSDPTPTPTPNALITVSSDGLNAQPTWTEENQIVSQDAIVMMVEVLFAVY